MATGAAPVSFSGLKGRENGLEFRKSMDFVRVKLHITKVSVISTSNPGPGTVVLQPASYESLVLGCLLSQLAAFVLEYNTKHATPIKLKGLAVMSDVKISQVGKYNDIAKLGSDFINLLGAHKEAPSKLDHVEGITEDCNNLLSAEKDVQNVKHMIYLGRKGTSFKKKERKAKLGHLLLEILNIDI